MPQPQRSPIGRQSVASEREPLKLYLRLMLSYLGRSQRVAVSGKVRAMGLLDWRGKGMAMANEVGRMLTPCQIASLQERIEAIFSSRGWYSSPGQTRVD